MSESNKESRRGFRRPGLATQVLLGFLLGVGTGLFLGEYAAFLDIVGMVFIRLLQMTVLPYVVVSLIAGLGRLGVQDAGRLALRGGAFVVLFWIIGLIAVTLIPFSYPEWASASFFSASLVEQAEPLNFVDLYFTANPFNALANTVVPAVVVFSIALGAALIGVPGKERIIDDLAVIGEALAKLAGLVARTAPIGVFGIAAGAAGTIDFGELARIQVYLIPYALVALVLSFVVLPGLVAVLTPIRPMRFIRETWGALITGFATGSVFVVLPFLVRASKDLLAEAGLDREESGETVGVMIPTTYNFPSTGALLSLSFMLFAGWFIGSPVALSRYPEFLISGLFSFFGSVMLAVPFLLNVLQLPADLFQLFVAVNVIAGRFGTLLAAVHLTALAVLATAAMQGKIRLQVARLGQLLGVAAVSLGLVLVGSYVYFTYLVPQQYQGYRMFVQMDLAAERVPTVLREEPAEVVADPRPAFDVFQDRGTLRVCYRPDALPFSFRNADARLVGYDVELASLLARDLGVGLEFVRVPREEIVAALQRGVCDLSVTSIPFTPDLTRQVSFASPHLEGTAAFIVPDHRREEFSSRAAVQAHESLRIGMPDVPYYERILQDYLPKAEILLLDSPRPFLRGEVEGLDAYLYTAEAGSAWTLVYPAFSVAVPKPDILAIPAACAVRKGDPEWLDYLDAWIELKRKDEDLDRLFDRWILGEEARSSRPRWSVIRDVLGWVE
ncbi:MAG: cation:dicarboxylase symporter family transporter [Acidobacteriota bacterium]